MVINVNNLIAPANTPVRNPKFTTVKWSKSKAKVGEEITLEANLSDQYANAQVDFKIFKDGADVEKDKPVMKVVGQNKGGKAEAKVVFNEPRKDDKDDEIKYFCQAWSFKCEKTKSGNITIEKVKPEYENMKWFSIKDEKDKKSKEEEITKIEISKKVKLKADVKNVENTELVHLKIYEKNYKEDNEYLISEHVEVKDGKFEYIWTANCDREKLDKLKENDKIKYVYILEAYKVKSKKSGEIELTFGCDINIDVNPDDLDYNDEFELKSSDGSYSKTKKASDDKIEGDDKVTLHFDELKAGLKYSLEHKKQKQVLFKDIHFSELFDIMN